MVDLSLASSYLPAFVCLAKTLVATAAALLVLPAGGLPALAVLLQMDRLFLNTDFIFDVNALLSLAIAFTAARHDRTRFGVATPFATPLAAAWGLLMLAQMARPTLRPRTEICAYAGLFMLLSVTYETQDPLGTALARATAHITLTLLHIYWHTATGHEEPLTLTATRLGGVMMGNTAVATFTALAASVALAAKWHASREGGGVVAGGDAHTEPNDLEAAAALREILASRKEKGGS
jgi:hypothetical protein